MFSLLVERSRDQMKRADRRAGGIMAALYNLNARASETDPIHDWWDFFSEWKPPMKEQTEEEMLATMLLFTKQTEGLPH